MIEKFNFYDIYGYPSAGYCVPLADVAAASSGKTSVDDGWVDIGSDSDRSFVRCWTCTSESNAEGFSSAHEGF